MSVRMALAICLALGLPHPSAAQTASSSFALDRTDLVFGVLAGNTDIVTPPQPVFLETRGHAPRSWTAASDRPWLVVHPAAGEIPARLTIAVRLGDGNGPAEDAGEVVVRVNDDERMSQRVRVRLRVVPGPQPPIGALDLPADRTVVHGGIRFAGWALHDVFLSRVAICRDPVPRAAADETCGDGLTHLGDATIYSNARPDVAALAATKPRYDRSGWTYVLDGGALPRGARGSFRVYAVARGIDGTRAVLGMRTITVPPEQGASPMSPRMRTAAIAIVFALGFHLLLRLCRSRLPEPSPGASPRVEPVSPFEAAVASAIATAAFLFNVRALTSGLTYDELYTATHFVVGVPLWKSATTASLFNNHVAYSLAAGLTARVAGATEFALRLPAALLGAAAVLAIWRFGRSAIDRRAGVLAAVVLALMPFHNYWSRMARGYTGLALMTVLATHGFLTTMRGQSRSAPVQHGTALVLATYFHLFGAWIFLVQYATFVGMALRSIARPDVAPLPRPVFTRLWLSFLASGAVTLALYTPQLEELLDSLTFFSETAGADPTIVQGLWSALAGSDSAPIRNAVAALVVLGTVELWRRDRLAAGSVVALLAVPLALLVTVLQTRYLRDRYLSYWTPMFALAFAGGLMFLAEAPARIRRWRLPDRSGMAVAMGLLIVVGVEWARRDARMHQGHGYAEALAELNQPPAARTYAVGADSEMFQYYVRERLNRVSGVDELEGLMATLPALRVAYHDVEWNSPVHRDMNALLDRRCRASVHPPVILYTCGVTE